jgi:hypothetical protein
VLAAYATVLAACGRAVTGNRAGWQYALAGLFIASIAAVISYNDGLFVARLAGNHDRQAFLYPLLPDGLIVVCLLALVEGARMVKPERSGWASAGLVLGIGMTLAMNAGAGIAHSVLDAVIDGLVPVVFFIAVEVVLWHVRRGRGAVPAAVPVKVPLPSVREIRARQDCGQATALKARAEVQLDRRGRGGPPPSVPAAHVPAGVVVAPATPPAPAGTHLAASNGATR